jgi:hypothetical protein
MCVCVCVSVYVCVCVCVCVFKLTNVIIFKIFRSNSNFDLSSTSVVCVDGGVCIMHASKDCAIQVIDRL